jgi:hypothetical protein
MNEGKYSTTFNHLYTTKIFREELRILMLMNCLLHLGNKAEVPVHPKPMVEGGRVLARMDRTAAMIDYIPHHQLLRKCYPYSTKDRIILNHMVK